MLWGFHSEIGPVGKKCVFVRPNEPSFLRCPNSEDSDRSLRREMAIAGRVKEVIGVICRLRWKGSVVHSRSLDARS